MAQASAQIRSAVLEQFPTLKKDVAKFPVRPGEDAWTTNEIFEVVEALLTERSSLENELTVAAADLSELLRNSGDGSGDDQADYGSSALEREQELTFVNNTRDLFEQNKRALGRIQGGTYGVCESCNEPIGKARQQAFPRATLCVTCKQREERR